MVYNDRVVCQSFFWYIFCLCFWSKISLKRYFEFYQNNGFDKQPPNPIMHNRIVEKTISNQPKMEEPTKGSKSTVDAEDIHPHVTKPCWSSHLEGGTTSNPTATTGISPQSPLRFSNHLATASSPSKEDSAPPAGFLLISHTLPTFFRPKLKNLQGIKLILLEVSTRIPCLSIKFVYYNGKQRW